MKRFYNFMLLCMVIWIFTGCSLDQNREHENLSGVLNTANYNSDSMEQEMVYQVKQSQLDFNQNNLACYAKQDGKLYILGYLGDSETKKLNYLLMSLDEEGKMEQSTSIPSIPHYVVRELVIDSKQNFWGLADEVSGEQNLDNGEGDSAHLIQFDQNGKVLRDQVLKDLTKTIESVAYSHLIADKEGSILLMEKNQQGKNSILVLNEDGEIEQTSSVSDQMIGLIQTNDRNIYAYEIDANGTIQTYEVQADVGVVGQIGMPLNVSSVKRLFGGMNGEIFAVTDQG